MRMKHALPVICAIALALCLAPSPAVPSAVAMGMMDGPGMMHHQGPRMMGGSRARHRYAMHQGLAPKYARMDNPLAATPANVQAGKALFDQNCARCHGATGRGDGESGRNLVPRPANLAHVVQMPIATDGYLYWAIAEGGAAFNTAMPAWKDALQDNDIWMVILYLHALPP